MQPADARVPLSRSAEDQADEDQFLALYGPWAPSAEDGIRYLLPEIVLVYKARLRRPKDESDFEATLPTLTAERRAWLRAAVEVVAPEHPWLSRL